MVLCEALQIPPEVLLIGRPGVERLDYGYSAFENGIEKQMVKEYLGLSDSKKKRLLAYMNMLQNMKE